MSWAPCQLGQTSLELDDNHSATQPPPPSTLRPPPIPFRSSHPPAWRWYTLVLKVLPIQAVRGSNKKNKMLPIWVEFIVSNPLQSDREWWSWCFPSQLVASIVFISFGVVAAFCCAIVDGVFAARHIVSITEASIYLSKLIHYVYHNIYALTYNKLINQCHSH